MKRLCITILSGVFLFSLLSSAYAASPTTPEASCTSHRKEEPSTKNTMDVEWIASTDSDGDLMAYAIVWDNSPNTTPWSPTRSASALTQVTSDVLEDGSWYFHIRAVDEAGNFSDVVHLGPFVIDTQPDIFSVSPNVGIQNTSTGIVIEGTDFMSDVTVSIGDTEMSNVTFVDATELRVTIPPDSGLTLGTHALKVLNNPNKRSGTKENAFTIIVDVDLTDAIRILQVLVGTNPDGDHLIGDVNSDGRIGMSEVVSILRVLSYTGYVTKEPESLQSEKARISHPDVSESDLGELVSGNTDFALDFYHTIGGELGENKNLFFSPYSISLALAMTYAGAENQTESQMADALCFTLSQERLHPAFNMLDLELAGRGNGAEGQDGEGFRLNIANSIWGQKDYPFLPSFLDVLAENYGAGLNLLDFSSAPDESRTVINNWVSDKTEEKIRDLLPVGSVSSDTRLVLTNAIYFNAAWKFPFEESLTQDGLFHLADGQSVTVPMMSVPEAEHFGYAEGEGYQAVELKYDGDELSMMILLPDAGSFSTFEGSLTKALADTVADNLEQISIDLKMPKFTYKSDSVSLKNMLSDMGMPAAFGGDADFSGMTGERGLFISDIFHKAFVAVDEAGTEAAAATAVVMDESMAMPGKTVTIDRPFIFFIRDIRTKAILFMGRILNPS